MIQNIVQTLYFKTYGNDPIQSQVRFLSPEFHWMSWSLSCLRLKALYKKIDLYTDSRGAEVLITRLGLPYDHVDLTLSSCNIPDGLAILPKIYTYSLQTEPFIHFDGDVFIWEKVRQDLIRDDILVQNRERANNFYRTLYKRLSNYNVWLPDNIINQLNSDKPVRVFNTGIFGANNIGFVADFVRASFKIVENNYNKLQLLAYSDFDLVYEQHLLYCIAKEQNIKAGFYLKQEIKDLRFEGFAEFKSTPFDNKFIHLLGLYKRDASVCLMLARRLRYEYPVYYYRIIKECRMANIKLYLDYYNDSDLTIEDTGVTKASALRNEWDRLYMKEKLSYAFYESTFSNQDVLSRTTFLLNDQVKFGKSPPDHDKNFYSFVTVPSSLLKDFTTVECDELDNLIITLVKKPATFLKIAASLKIYFRPHDIESNYSAYLQLITLRLQSGCEQNLYFIVQDSYEDGA